MKSITFFKRTALTVFVLLLSIAAYAQTGKISGTVSDKKTGETLIGVTVKIKGTTKGVSTDVDGHYTLQAMANGKYTLEFSYLGYQTKEVSDVDVKAPAVTSLNVILNEAGGQNLQEVVVKASFKQESVNSLYAQQKNSIRISDGISAQTITRSPDKNTGEVLKRVSGTSIQDNKFVVIRGLGDRYNTTLMNNAVLPSSEADKKAFSFDVVPSNLIDNIIISKTATPDLPGDFAGGAVQISTKDFPEQKVMNLQVGSGFNTKTTFKDFLQGSRGGTDFLGFDDGSRALPSSYVKVKNNYTNSSVVSDEQRSAISQSFANTFGVFHNFKAAPTYNAQFTLGNTKVINEDSKFGYMFSVNYRNSLEILTRQRNDYNTNGESLYQFNDNIYQSGNSSGALLNLSYAYKANKFSLKNFFSNSFSNNYTDRRGQFNESGDITNLKSSQTDVTQNGLFNTVLDGQHLLERSKISIDYNLSFGLTYKNQPDQRIIEQIQRPNVADKRYYVTITSINNPAIQNAGRVYSTLNENIYGGKFNISKPYKLFGETNKVKAGYLTSYRDRTFNIDALGYTTSNGLSKSIFIDNGTTTENIFAPSNLKNNEIILSTIPDNSFSYNGVGFLNAGYLQTENKFANNWRLIIGARVENYKQELTPTGNSDKKKQTYVNTDILPSANLTYALTEKSNLRLSASRTVARPEFRELASFLYYDFVTDFTVRGNPNLERTLITNVDARYELFPGAGQIFSVSAFYKKFSNAIEQTNGGNKDLNYANAKSAYDFGAEIEFRKRLDFIESDSFWKNFTFYANAAFIKSKVNIAQGNSNRPLQGQSPYLINGGLQYEVNDGDFIVNILYNRIGQRLVFVGVQGGLDTYEKPRDQIDLQLSKKLIKNRAEIKLNVADILAQRQALYYNYDTKPVYNEASDKIVQSTLPGRNISLSFNYKF